MMSLVRAGAALLIGAALVAAAPERATYWSYVAGHSDGRLISVAPASFVRARDGASALFRIRTERGASETIYRVAADCASRTLRIAPLDGAYGPARPALSRTPDAAMARVLCERDAPYAGNSVGPVTSMRAESYPRSMVHRSAR